MMQEALPELSEKDGSRDTVLVAVRVVPSAAGTVAASGHWITGGWSS